MGVNYSKSAVEFLKEKLNQRAQTRVRNKIASLQAYLETTGKIPFPEIDIKKLKGKWEGCYRIRVNNIRVIW